MDFHFYLGGRLVYVKTGPHTQTVNVCDARNKRGQDNCDWKVRVARQHFVVEVDLSVHSSVENMVDWLAKNRGGKIEKRPLDPKEKAMRIRTQESAGRRPRDIKNIDCSQSLHFLKDDHFRRTYMGVQCEQLAKGLTEAIAATVCCAPVRRNPYFRHRQRNRMPYHLEARWEEAMWRRWSDPNCEPVADAWHWIPHYQMMMRHNNRRNKGWGEMDLIGLRTDGVPITIELKVPRGEQIRTCTPASTLIQAAAYAIALRNAWPIFRPQWEQKIEPYLARGAASPPIDVVAYPLVCAAPRSYWNEWTAEGAGDISTASWESFCKLRKALENAGFPSTFVAVDHDGYDDDRLPRITKAEPVILC